MKRLLILLIVLFGLISPVFAENFYIKNYDVNIIVDKSKSADVTEKIDVVFTTPSHGIYRDIPLKNSTVTNVNISERYSTTYSPSNINFKIGNPDKLISGKHHYEIHYKYNYLDSENEFYHNIIGTDWKVNINKVFFNITFPENIIISNPGISIGKYGKQGFDGDAVFEVKQNNISGYTKRKLLPHEGITLRLTVPEGYFKYKPNNTMNSIVMTGIIILTLVSFFIWLLFGKDDKAIPVINFNIPDGLNALELELIYNGKCTNKGIVGLLIELAQKGYIKINDDGHSWSLEKLKNYDGVKKSEKDLMNAIFKGYHTKVSQSSLAVSTTFYGDCQNIISDTNKRRNQIFCADSVGCVLPIIMTFCIIGILFLTIFSLAGYDFSNIRGCFPLLLFPVVAVIVLIWVFWGTAKFDEIKNSQQTGNRKEFIKLSKFFARIFVLAWAFLFGSGPIFILTEMISYTPQLIRSIVTGIIGLIIAGICTYQLPKRNKTGQNIYNDLLGLKQFIEVAEKDRLKKLVEEDPQYFYKILPAAYIFGISDKWINKFESITNINPDWYSGNLNTGAFNDFTDIAAKISMPSVENGGIHISSSSGGGGGFSGGGGGGGGGGSW